ncbi:Uncharacterised protein [Pragia fontium]|nr:Uncharacterised protein [Pragia fontium]VEJ54167.1 Uncharacterised protein [Pragia fontium]
MNHRGIMIFVKGLIAVMAMVKLLVALKEQD